MYIYSGQQALEEQDMSATGGMIAMRDLVYGNGGVDDVVAIVSGSSVDYLHKDSLGSTIAVTNGSGAVLSEYRYDAFGKTYEKSSSGTWLAVSSSSITDRLFTGRELDFEADLYYYRAREYSPSS